MRARAWRDSRVPMVVRSTVALALDTVAAEQAPDAEVAEHAPDSQLLQTSPVLLQAPAEENGGGGDNAYSAVD